MDRSIPTMELLMSPKLCPTRHRGRCEPGRASAGVCKHVRSLWHVLSADASNATTGLASICCLYVHYL